jgi:hypothetical protein
VDCAERNEITEHATPQEHATVSDGTHPSHTRGDSKQEMENRPDGTSVLQSFGIVRAIEASGVQIPYLPLRPRLRVPALPCGACGMLSLMGAERQKHKTVSLID